MVNVLTVINNLEIIVLLAAQLNAQLVMDKIIQPLSLDITVCAILVDMLKNNVSLAMLMSA